MEAIKPNDWLATLVKNPEMNLSDFRRNGITADNTGLKSKDEYKKMQAVKESPAFINKETGKFDEEKFNSYYDSALALYNQYAEDDQLGRTVEFAYASDAFWAPSTAKRLDLKTTISLDNPYKDYNQGISYITSMDVSKQQLSTRELAQTQDAVDSQTGKSLGWTPNDFAGSVKGLFKSFSRPTLVLAQYEEDGSHKNADGVWVEHHKGDYKTNAEGNPYYETLGNRDIVGKDVLRVSDTLTVDGGKFNKLDIFDSDDIKKSAGKVAAKTAASVVMMMTPGVGEVYGVLTAASALGRVMPVIGKALDSTFMGTDDNEFGKALNVWEGYMARFDQTASDNARNKQVTFENLGNLVSSISGQLFQQRAVAKMGYLIGKKPELAKQLSFAYMAATSAQDNYDAFKEAGLNDRAAGLAMIGSMAALHGLMQIDYFKNNSVFKGTMLDESAVLAPSRQLAKDFAGEVSEKGIVAAADTEPLAFATKCRSIYAKRLEEGLTKSEFVNRSIAEGVEEVMEEMSTDLIKAFNKGLDAVGFKVTEDDKELDFGIDLKDIVSRYGMNFAGGILGGAIFYGQNKWEIYRNNGFKMPQMDPDAKSKMVYLIAEGHGDEIKAYYKKWHERGWLGDPNLSMSTELVTTPTGETVVSTTQGRSQNDIVYDLLNNFVDNVEQQVKSVAPYFRNRATWDSLKTYGYDMAQVLTNPNLLSADGIRELQTHSTMYNDTVQALSDIVALNSQLAKKTKEIAQGITGDQSSSEEARKKAIEKDKEIKDLKEQIKQKQEFVDSVFKGEKTKYYAGQALFYANTELNKRFGNLSLDAFSQEKYGGTFESFNEDTQEKIREDFAEYQSKTGADRVYASYDVYLALSQRWGTIIKQETDALKKAYEENILDLDLIGTDINIELKKVEELEAKQAELLSKSRTAEEEEELQKVSDELAKIDERVTKIRLNPQFALLQGKSAREFYKMFSTDEEGNTTVDTIALSEYVLKHYADIASKNGYLLNDDMLEILLTNVREDFIKSGQFDADSFEDHLNVLLGEKSEDDEFELPAETYQEIRRLYTATIENLGKNNREAMEAYNGLVNVLKGVGFTDEMLQELFYSDYFGKGDLGFNYLPLIGNKPFNEYLSEIDGHRVKCKKSLYATLANQLSFDYNGKRFTLFDLLAQESEKLSNVERLTDYVINDPTLLSLFDQGSELDILLKGMEGVILGMSDGTNENINNFKGGTIENLVVLDKEQSATFRSQMIDTLEKIDFLLQLSRHNALRALNIQKDIAVNMRPKFVSILINDGVDNSFATIFSWVDEAGVKHSISPKAIWEEVSGGLSLNNVTDFNYPDIEKLIIKFEDRLYEKFQEAKFSKEELAQKILSLRSGNDLIELASTKLSTLKKEAIKPYDVCMYVATMVSMASSDFYGKLAKTVPNLKTVDGKELAPIYAQEFGLRLATAMMANKTLFNNIMEEMNKAEFIEKYNSKSTNEAEKNATKERLENRPILYNMAVVLGSAGSGKTVGVAGTLVNLLGTDDVEFIAVGPESDQAEKIAKQLGTNIKSYSKNDFFKEALGKEVGNYAFMEKDGHEIDHIVAKSKIGNGSAVFTGEKKCKVLVVDEIGKMNEAELQRLCNWAKENDVFILGLGDLKQSVSKIKAKRSGENKGQPSKDTYTCLEDCTYIKAPLLTTSLRLENLAKYDNYVYLDTLLNEIRDGIHIETSINDANSLVTKAVQLYYYEDDSQLCGEKIVNDKDALMAELKKLAKANPDKEFAIITDNLSDKTYKSFIEKNPDLNIKLIPYSSMQGGEWDYVFVDVNFNDDANKFNLLRAVYTLSQRSRIGTVMINKGIFGDGRLTLEKNNGSVPSGKQNVGKRSDKEIQDFKTWRLMSLSEVSETEGFMNVILADCKEPKAADIEAEKAKKAAEEAEKARIEAAEKAEKERLAAEEEARKKAEEEAKRNAKQNTEPPVVEPIEAEPTPPEEIAPEVLPINPEDDISTEEPPVEPIEEPKPIEEPVVEEVDDFEDETPAKPEIKPDKLPKSITFSNERLFELMLDNSFLSRFTGITGLGAGVSTIESNMVAMMIGSIVRCKGTYDKAIRDKKTFVTKADWNKLILKAFESDSPIVKALKPYATNNSKLWVSRLNGNDCVLTYRAYNEDWSSYIEFPVAIIPNCIATGEYVGDIVYKKGSFRRTKGTGEKTRISDLFKRGIYKFLHQTKTLGILVGTADSINNDSKFSDRTKKHLVSMLGKTFTIISDEWYRLNNTRDTSKNIWDRGEQNAIAEYGNVALINCQVTVDPEDIFSYIGKVMLKMGIAENEDAQKLIDWLDSLDDSVYTDKHVDLGLLAVRGQALEEAVKKKKFLALSQQSAASFVSAILSSSQEAWFSLRTILGYSGTGRRNVLILNDKFALTVDVTENSANFKLSKYKNGKIGDTVIESDAVGGNDFINQLLEITNNLSLSSVKLATLRYDRKGKLKNTNFWNSNKLIYYLSKDFIYNKEKLAQVCETIREDPKFLYGVYAQDTAGERTSDKSLFRVSENGGERVTSASEFSMSKYSINPSQIIMEENPVTIETETPSTEVVSESTVEPIVESVPTPAPEVVSTPDVVENVPLSTQITEAYPEISGLLGNMSDSILASCDSLNSLDPINNYLINTSTNWRCKQIVMGEDGKLSVKTTGNEFFKEWFCKKNGIDINNVEEIEAVHVGIDDDVAYIMETCGYANFYVYLLDGTIRVFTMNDNFPTGREIKNIEIMDALVNITSNMGNISSESKYFSILSNYLISLFNGSETNYDEEWIKALTSARYNVEHWENPNGLLIDPELEDAKDELTALETLNNYIVDFLQKKLELDDECL